TYAVGDLMSTRPQAVYRFRPRHQESGALMAFQRRGELYTGREPAMVLRLCVRAVPLFVAVLLFSASPSPFARDMLAAHNGVRSRTGVPPLAWSDRLATAAERWADALVRRNEFAHNPKTPYGENLFEVMGGSGSAAEIVSDWASEEKNYNYAKNSCRGV